MTSFGFIVAVCAAIIVVLAARAFWVVRHEKDAPRGSEPGDGYHEIDASYYSGGGGGGWHATFKVPKDPQEYARHFIPRDKR